MRLPKDDITNLIEFRAARAGDIDALVGLYQLFFADSNLSTYGLGYDPARARAWVEPAIRGGRYPHILAVDKTTDSIVGSIAYSLNNQYDKPVALMDKFFVRREWRRSAVGHVLLTLSMDAAKAEDAVVYFVFVNSGIPGSQDFFRDFGFRETPHSAHFVKEL